VPNRIPGRAEEFNAEPIPASDGTAWKLENVP
jgi:hypothetical protein